MRLTRDFFFFDIVHRVLYTRSMNARKQEDRGPTKTTRGGGSERRARRLTDERCPRCVKAYYAGAIWQEMIQQLPPGAYAPLAKVPGGGPCCYDCAAADTVQHVAKLPTWEHARTAVGNEREEQLRLPGALRGLVALGLVRPSRPGDLARRIAWQKRCLANDQAITRSNCDGARMV